MFDVRLSDNKLVTADNIELALLRNNRYKIIDCLDANEANALLIYLSDSDEVLVFKHMKSLCMSIKEEALRNGYIDLSLYNDYEYENKGDIL